MQVGHVGGRLCPITNFPVASGSLNGNAPSAWTPFSSGRTAAFAASTFAALRLTGRLGSGSLVAGCPSWPDRAVKGLLALASPPSEVTHSQVYWLVLPEESRATGVIPC